MKKSPKKNKKSVKSFLESIKDQERRRDAKIVFEIMKEVTKKEPVMWGPSIIGFDDYHYKYASGREGDWFKLGFSPRKENLTLYIMPGYQDFDKLLKDLGPHKTGKSCLYIKRLSDINMPTLKKIIKKGYKEFKLC